MANNTNDPLNEDLESMCRLCLDKCPVYFSIFENEAAVMLEALTSIKVNCNDYSSKIICSRCLTELQDAYQTQQKFIKVERLILEKLSKKMQSVQEKEKIKEEIITSDVDYDPEKQSLEVSSFDSTDDLKLDVIDIKNECTWSPEKFSDADTTDCVDYLDRKHFTGFCESNKNFNSVSVEEKVGLQERNTEESTAFMPEEGDAEEAAENETLNQLPAKSRSIYEKTYNEFLKWCKVKKIKIVNENVLLEYFDEQSKIYKSSSLWTRYSMIRANLTAKDNLDISKFRRLYAFLKRQSEGYEPKKSKVLSREQILKFFVEAPDNTFLMIKVALIMGIFGVCSRDELTQLTLDDIEDGGSALMVKIKNPMTNIDRTFPVINSEEIEVDFLGLFRKYLFLRPLHTGHRRLFISYKNGKCTAQVVGKNRLAKVQQTIAKFLKLPDPSAYIGRFRRSSATFLAGTDAVKNHFNWKTSTAADSYDEDSWQNKMNTVNVLSGKELTAPSTSFTINVPNDRHKCYVNKGRIHQRLLN